MQSRRLTKSTLPEDKVIEVSFYKTNNGANPVRDWLINDLSKSERNEVGEKVRFVELNWPIGMPHVRKIQKDLWEVRVLLDNKVARVLFTVFERKMILLHSFIKKTQKIPTEDLKLAIKRMKSLETG